MSKLIAERASSLTNELVNDSVLDVSSVVPVQQHLALHVKEVYGAARHPLPFSGSENTETLKYCKSNTCFVTGLFLVFFLPSIALIVPFASPMPTNIV